MRHGTARVRATAATGCAMFPALAQIKPDARCSGGARSMAATTPRILYEPNACKLSALIKIGSLPPIGTSGVRRTKASSIGASCHQWVQARRAPPDGFGCKQVFNAETNRLEDRDVARCARPDAHADLAD